MKDFYVSDISISCLCVYKFLNLHLEDYVSEKHSLTYRFMYMANGKMDVFVNKQRYTLLTGDVLFLPADSMYDTQCYGKRMEVYNVMFSLQGEARDREKDYKQTIYSDTSADYRVNFVNRKEFNGCRLYKSVFAEEDFKEIEMNYFHKGELGYLANNARLTLFFLKLLEPAPTMENPLYKRVLAYIDENILTEISCASVAQNFHFHQNYLNKVLRNNTGQGLHASIMSAKCKCAARLLVETDKSITMIAQDLYFNDSSHFSNVFRRFMKCTPTMYRKLQN